MRKVWITRSLPGALKTQDVLKSKGYEGIAAPLLEICPPYTRPDPLPEKAVLIITSKNGGLYLSQHTERRHWPMIAVGDATAAYLKVLGFENTVSASGTSHDVIALVKTLYREDTRPIIHVGGRYVRGQIMETLRASGFKAEHRVFYDSQPVDKLPMLDFGTISQVMVYSPMAAQVLRDFSPDIAHISAISISEETDKALEGLALKQRLIADQPTENAMLRLLD